MLTSVYGAITEFVPQSQTSSWASAFLDGMRYQLGRVLGILMEYLKTSNTPKRFWVRTNISYSRRSLAAQLLLANILILSDVFRAISNSRAGSSKDQIQNAHCCDQQMKEFLTFLCSLCGAGTLCPGVTNQGTLPLEGLSRSTSQPETGCRMLQPLLGQTVPARQVPAPPHSSQTHQNCQLQRLRMLQKSSKLSRRCFRSSFHGVRRYVNQTFVFMPASPGSAGLMHSYISAIAHL